MVFSKRPKKRRTGKDASFLLGSRFVFFTYGGGLAAQCEIAPHIAIPFRDSMAEGGIARVSPCFHGGIAQVSLRYPFFWGGGIAPLLRMLSEGEMPRKGGGGIAPN